MNIKQHLTIIKKRIKGEYISGLGIPTEFKYCQEYMKVLGDGTGGLDKIVIHNDTGGVLIYEKFAKQWWVRYDDVVKVDSVKH